MRRYIPAALLTVVIAAAWIALLPAAVATQPIAFPHARHRALACTVCHRGAATSTRATIPDVAFCGKCHATPPRGTTAAWEAASARQTFGWMRVTRVLPPHVMFSHQRHVTLARLDCASCHGDMRDRMAPPSAAPTRIAMATCLGCHRQEGAADDCAACHR